MDWQPDIRIYQDGSYRIELEVLGEIVDELWTVFDINVKESISNNLKNDNK